MVYLQERLLLLLLLLLSLLLCACASMSVNVPFCARTFPGWCVAWPFRDCALVSFSTFWLYPLTPLYLRCAFVEDAGGFEFFSPCNTVACGPVGVRRMN